MNKEKQIEEMARIIGHCESTLHPDIECHNKATGCYCIENPCHNQRIAEQLYTAGYRKQSEGEWLVDAWDNEKEEWVTIPYNKHLHADAYCSLCKNQALLDGAGMGVASKYCPECGAKMQGGAE